MNALQEIRLPLYSVMKLCCIKSYYLCKTFFLFLLISLSVQELSAASSVSDPLLTTVENKEGKESIDYLLSSNVYSNAESNTDTKEDSDTNSFVATLCKGTNHIRIRRSFSVFSDERITESEY